MSPAFERSCVSCRARAPRANLRRFVVRAAIDITPDDAQRAHGRGAYLCAACATKPPLGALRRALRAPAATLCLTPALDR